MDTVAALETYAGIDSESVQAPFGTALRHRLEGGAGDAPVVAIAVQPEQVLSPELALVDPELRAFALEQLPARNPDAFLLERPLSTTTGNLPSLEPAGPAGT